MNTDVPGSPGSCRATAEALDRLARRLEEAGRLAGRGARTPDSRFDGRTADSYRAACAALSDGAATQADAVRRAGGALASYADDLGDVQRVMERVRESAAGHGLLDGTRLALPPAPVPEQERAFDRLSVIAADALAHLESARDRLAGAFPGQPFPVDYADVLLPDGPSEPAGAFPPPESSWPRDAQRPDEREPDGRPDHRRPDEPAAPGRSHDDVRDPGGCGSTPPTGPRPDAASPPEGAESQPDGTEPQGLRWEVHRPASDHSWLPGPVLRPVPEAVP